MNQFIQVFVPHSSVRVLEVRAHGDQQIAAFVVTFLFIHKCDEIGDFRVNVVVFQVRVVHDRIRVAAIVEAKASWRLIQVC